MSDIGGPGGHRQCAGCGDDIWPNEPEGDTCAICQAREALRRAERERDDAILTLNNVRDSLELVGANFDRVDAANAELTRANTKFHARAVMAEAERDRMRPVVEAATEAAHTPFGEGVADAVLRLRAAVDVYETQHAAVEE